MECKKCGVKNKSTARFCRQCGQPLESQANLARCKNCGCENRPTSRFCRSCGQPINTKPTPVSVPATRPSAPISQSPDAILRPGEFRSRERSRLDDKSYTDSAQESSNTAKPKKQSSKSGTMSYDDIPIELQEAMPPDLLAEYSGTPDIILKGHQDRLELLTPHQRQAYVNAWIEAQNRFKSSPSAGLWDAVKKGEMPRSEWEKTLPSFEDMPPMMEYAMTLQMSKLPSLARQVAYEEISLEAAIQEAISFSKQMPYPVQIESGASDDTIFLDDTVILRLRYQVHEFQITLLISRLML